jgi:hypothetical protein
MDWPGDLGLQFALARAYLAEGNIPLAASILETLTAADPEDFPAQRLLGQQLLALKHANAALALACAHVGDGQSLTEGVRFPDYAAPPSREAVIRLPSVNWAAPARAAHLAARIGDWETARRELEAVLVVDTPAPLPSLLHLGALWHAGQLDLARPLAEGFLARWPRVVAFKLCLAECLLAAGDHPRAIELLHDAATQDSGGQVVTRHWGTAHPYRSLWETNVSIPLPGPMPAELVAALGHNRLTANVGHASSVTYSDDTPNPRSGFSPNTRRRFPTDADAGATSNESLGHNRLNDPARHRLETDGYDQPNPRSGFSPNTRRRFPTDAEAGATDNQAEGISHASSVTYSAVSEAQTEETLEIQSQLDSLAKKLLGQKTGLHYVILSSRTRLTQVFGLEGFTAIDAILQTFTANITARTELQASLVYVDDPSMLSPFGLRPVNPANAWDIKRLLGQLNARLQTQRQAIGALLIVGGAEIIPFHHLPNPTDDADPDIPSDNPYATADENYFVPEWPVGRIPSGAGSNPAALVRALRAAANAYSAKSARKAENWFARFKRWLFAQPSPRSFGYSANIWKNASAAVYTLIGDPRDLLTSPPTDANALPTEGLSPSNLSYFNLHGVEDGAEWYGQRSAEDSEATMEYPVALRPADVVNSGRAPIIVFSEACYGANILGKNTEDALCLRFLDSGSRALVGSTKTAYGSVTTPLIGADLLGHGFWKNVNAGLPVGEALRRAKLQMAQEMHTRQGFLDGEDQKTLISFVLYGDPLATAPNVSPKKPGFSKRNRVSAQRVPQLAEPPLTVCDKSEGDHEITPQMVAQIKKVVAQYLPGMQDAHWRVAHTHAGCAGKNHACPTAHLAKIVAKHPERNEVKSKDAPRHTVVTLSKTIRANARVHPHYARLTLDEKGVVVKMAVSR